MEQTWSFRLVCSRADRLRRRTKKAASAASARPARTPPTTPPTIAPVCEDECVVLEEEEPEAAAPGSVTVVATVEVKVEPWAFVVLYLGGRKRGVSGEP